MGWDNSGTRNPNAPCPDPNKHCGDAIPPGASIDIWVWKAIGITFALTFAYLICNPKKRRLVSEFLSSVLALGVLVVVLVMFKKQPKIKKEYFIPHGVNEIINGVQKVTYFNTKQDYDNFFKT